MITLIQPVDWIGENCERLPLVDVRELNVQMNVNTCDDCEEFEAYLNNDPVCEDDLVTVIDADEFVDWDIPN